MSSSNNSPAQHGPESDRVVHTYHDFSDEVDDTCQFEEGADTAGTEATQHMVANNAAAGLDSKVKGGMNEQQVFPVR